MEQAPYEPRTWSWRIWKRLGLQGFIYLPLGPFIIGPPLVLTAQIWAALGGETDPGGTALFLAPLYVLGVVGLELWSRYFGQRPQPRPCATPSAGTMDRLIETARRQEWSRGAVTILVWLLHWGARYAIVLLFICHVLISLAGMVLVGVVAWHLGLSKSNSAFVILATGFVAFRFLRRGAFDVPLAWIERMDKAAYAATARWRENLVRP